MYVCMYVCMCICMYVSHYQSMKAQMNIYFSIHFHTHPYVLSAVSSTLPSLPPSLLPSYLPTFALRGVQNQGLLHLSQSANKCKAVLEENLQLARRVVHLNELSRRLETVQEQVVGCDVNIMCGCPLSLDIPFSMPCHVKAGYGLTLLFLSTAMLFIHL